MLIETKGKETVAGCCSNGALPRIIFLPQVPPLQRYAVKQFITPNQV